MPVHAHLPVVVVVVLIVAVAGCSLPITEPPPYPGALRNSLDVPVDIYRYQREDHDSTTFVARLGPGDVYEVEPRDVECVFEGLVALDGVVEVGRLENRCDVSVDRVWVLDPDDNYTTDYYGSGTDYRD
jgi:hypothetical protein